MNTEKGERRVGVLLAGGALLLLVLAHAARTARAYDTDPIHLYNGLVFVALGPLSVILVTVVLARRAATRR
jgi:hypothetical protein